MLFKVKCCILAELYYYMRTCLKIHLTLVDDCYYLRSRTEVSLTTCQTVATLSTQVHRAFLKRPFFSGVIFHMKCVKCVNTCVSHDI